MISLTPKNTPNITPASSATFAVRPEDGDLPVSTAGAPAFTPEADDDVPSARGQA